jgi:murein DD-endopeptidase MepM/ murein hydrolase activator NlpD
MNRNFKRQKFRLGLSIGGVLVFVFGVLINVYAKQNTIEYDALAAIETPSPAISNEEIVKYEIKSGDTLSTVLGLQGITEDANQIIDASKGVYDFTKIKAGQILKFVFVEKAFASMEYAVTDNKVITVEKTDNGFEATENDIKYDINPTTVAGSINSSLFEDASAVGLQDKTIMELADVFGWDIDFTADIRQGDSFKVIYEQRSLNGEAAKPGKILGAWFENQGQKYWAILYKDSSGKEKYYDLDGNSVARQFLKSSLDYKYISTQYTNQRVNPVTKKLDTHKAIDFAAPSGTPVVAAADGTVVYADWKGGYGIDVEIQHENSYKTLNAHLSKIAKGIKNGVTVEQGQIIGYVGSTGQSTGPHLHFAMYKGGTPINPLTAELPKGEPVRESERIDYSKTRDQMKLLLDQI